MKRIGVDVGGTFTDLVYWDDHSGHRVVHKVSTTTENPAMGTVQGIVELCERAGIEPREVDVVVHGTTVATNIIVQRSGAKVGLITTEGFRDLLHIARKKRPLNFSSYQDVPWQKYPLVERRHRLTVRERVTGPKGEVLEPLDIAGARAAVRKLKDAGVESIAVCLLFSFLNPRHETAISDLIKAEFPGAFLSVSHEVVPVYREYERFSTTAVNAYIGPKTARYVRELGDSVAAIGIAGGVRLMTSAGGVITAPAAADSPVVLLMSGPAAGLMAGIEVGRSAGARGVITLDVGGTSSDIGVSPDGRLRMKHLLDTKIGGYDVMVPMLDVETVGAGGGSIASVNPQGILDVGPRSAGAHPGPICYGRGGTEPTVTDALVTLGWLRPIGLLGGRLKLDAGAARAGVAERVAAPLGLDVVAAALGIHAVCAHNMANAIAQLSVRKGHDPRELALVAQGGAGPAFACSVGRIIGIDRVLIPTHPGIASAFGLLSTDLRYEFASTFWELASALDLDRLTASFQRLLEQARLRLAADGLGEGDTAFELYADCRYAGQGYELRVPAEPGPFDSTWLGRLVDNFHEAHQRAYQRRFSDSDVQIVNIRVVGVGKMAPLQMRDLLAVAPDGGPRPQAIAETIAHFGPDAQPVRVPVYERGTLRPGARLDGPAIVEQMDTTIVIEPDFEAAVDHSGSLVLTQVGDQ
ncbi:hydantoinase/oxoprolinase family protein [bacterium]|nr:MAG: hydantoinase/oxoprolinase family protein [bacterium]